ncbi:hypothetical protein OJ253_548 [Cryptosporidium canis]|uniref:Nucleolar protein 12 n=1 Tax=Cryptosporidium canis TaxID=195482 RepID=A0A9D5DIK4_9CRYT|nr:hypothetical protein OJ253_548 [Cryptosporidium canis]
MAINSSKSVLTKHGRKGTVITFSMKKRESFLNGFQKRKKERRDKGYERKKLKEKQFRDGVKKEANEAMRKHIKTVEEICSASSSAIDNKSQGDLKEKEAAESAPKIIRYNGNMSSKKEYHPWSMPCSVKITDSI